MRRIAAFAMFIVALIVAGAPAATARTASAKAGGQQPPGSVTNVVAAAGDGQVTVTFDAPTTGGPVTEYSASVGDNLGVPVLATGTKSPIVVKGLQNNQLYTVTVQATNAAGPGPGVTAENLVVPSGSQYLPVAPDPPTGVTAVAGDGQVTVSYQAPVRQSDNFVVWGYVAVAVNLSHPGDGGQNNQVGFGNNPQQPAAATPINIGGLTNGDEYAFSVITVLTGSVDGTYDVILGSAPSAPSNTVTPARAPEAPAIKKVTPGDQQAVVEITPPGSDGGLPVTTYTVVADDWSAQLPNVVSTGATSPVTSMPLINGHTYSFTATATNAVGTSAPSESTQGVTLPLEPGKPPGAPSSVKARAGDASATVSFSAPARGGTPDSFTVYAQDTFGNQTETSGQKSPITITGLSNNTQWMISVAGNNASGTGPVAPAENVVFPSQNASTVVPDPPTDVTAVAGDGQATVSYQAPTRAVENYYVWGYIAIAVDLTHPANGGQNQQVGFANAPPFDNATPSPITIGGLTNGDLYAFSVVTVVQGDANPTFETVLASGPSALSAPVAIVGPPGAPKIGKATPGDGEVTVSFSAPANDGGAPIIDYTVIADDETERNPDAQTASGADSPIVVRQLTDGHTYTFRVVARNQVGISRPSDATAPVVPVPPSPTAPGAPTDVEGKAGDGQVTVSWKAPDNTGHVPILGYTVTAFDQTEPGRGGQSVASTTTSVTVTGLTSGDRYVFRVTATNGVGSGPASKPSDPVVPTGAAPKDESTQPDQTTDQTKEPATTTTAAS